VSSLTFRTAWRQTTRDAFGVAAGDLATLLTTEFYGAAGGSNFTLTPADAATATDTVAKAIGSARTDTAGTTDGLGNADAKAVADTASSLDAFLAAYGLTRTDAVTVTDVANPAIVIPNQSYTLFPTDSVLTADATLIGWGRSTVQVEVARIGLRARLRPTPAKARGTRRGDVDEAIASAVTAVDARLLISDFSRVFAETATPVDALQKAISPAVVVEAVSVTDGVQLDYTYVRTFAHSVAPTDGIVTLSAAGLTAASVAFAFDSIARAVAAAPADTLTLAETVARAADKLLGDTASAVDSLGKAITQATINDAVTATDVANPAIGTTIFVLVHAISGGAGASFAGAQPGDLGIIFAQSASSSSAPSIGTPAGWTQLANADWTAGVAYEYGIYAKVLNASDIANPITISGVSEYFSVAYRGPTVATVKTVNSTTSTSNATPGFTKNAGCKGLVLWCSDRMPSTPIVVPAIAASRINTTIATLWTQAVADIVNPANYPNGAALNWTSLLGTFGNFTAAVELT